MRGRRGDMAGGMRALAACLVLMAFVPRARAEQLKLPFLNAGLRLSTSKPAYWRYEMVDFQVDEAGGGGVDRGDGILAGESVLEVDIFKAGKQVIGLPGQEACLLRWDGNLQAWHGRWPIPFNPVLGVYEARLAQPAGAGQGREHVFFSGPGLTRTVRVAEGRWLARCSFTLRGRMPTLFSPGFSAVTLEPGASYTFPSPEGFGRGPMNAFAWARFMEADAFWHCALQTSWWPGQAAADLPWDRRDLQAMRAYAAQAPSQGVAYGAYMLTFLVGGDFQKTDYEFTLGYDARTNKLVPLRFISMEDSKRQREIIAALRLLSHTPGVAYIGMDYVRSNTGGLEFTDEFLDDFNLEVPAELRGATVQDRRLWLGRHLAYDHDRRLHELWDWWRAHKVSLVLKGMLDEARVSQPVWVFSLGWKQGHQHGQDPRMLIDAGVSFNSPMFYEADQDQYPILLGDWRHYLAKTGGALVLGQCVDARLLHPRPGFNGPEEHYQRQIEALQALGPLVNRLGFFWHDLNRAREGGHSPEGMREWALCGASSFARLREAAGTVPVSLSVTASGAEPELSGTLKVLNIGKTRLGELRVAGLWTPGLGDFKPRNWWILGLAPGEERDLTFTVSVTPRFVRARFRAGAPSERMVAFRAEVMRDPAWPRSDIAFTYWKAGAKP